MFVKILSQAANTSVADMDWSTARSGYAWMGGDEGFRTDRSVCGK